MRPPEEVALEICGLLTAEELAEADACIRADRREQMEADCRIVKSWGDQCAGGSGEEIIPTGPSKGQRYGEAFYNLVKAIRQRFEEGK